MHAGSVNHASLSHMNKQYRKITYSSVYLQEIYCNSKRKKARRERRTQRDRQRQTERERQRETERERVRETARERES